MKPLEPPDTHHLSAAQGWLELGNPMDAHNELEEISPRQRAHPAVLSVRYEVYAKSKKWNEAAEIAGTLVKLMPEQTFAWICLAYATRRKSGGGISDAKKISWRLNRNFPLNI